MHCTSQRSRSVQRDNYVFLIGESVPRAYRKAQLAAHVQYVYLHRQLLALFDGLHGPHLHDVTWAASIICQTSAPTSSAHCCLPGSHASHESASPFVHDCRLSVPCFERTAGLLFDRGAATAVAQIGRRRPPRET